MSKTFTFIGDPNDDFSGAHGKDGKEDQIITIRGVEFTKDEPVEVDCEKLIAKLSGNSHFAEGEAKPKPKAKPKAKKTNDEDGAKVDDDQSQSA